MVLGPDLLNTQYYKVRIKGKVEQSREWSSAIPYTLGVVAIEKRAFGSPSTKVANFTYFACFLSMFTFIFLIASEPIGMKLKKKDSRKTKKELM